jgi:hypothetical protein
MGRGLLWAVPSLLGIIAAQPAIDRRTRLSCFEHPPRTPSHGREIWRLWKDRQIMTCELQIDIRYDRKAIERRVREHIEGWRTLLTKQVQDGRQLLREVLADPLRFTPSDA